MHHTEQHIGTYWYTDIHKPINGRPTPNLGRCGPTLSVSLQMTRSEHTVLFPGGWSASIALFMMTGRRRGSLFGVLGRRLWVPLAPDSFSIENVLAQAKGKNLRVIVSLELSDSIAEHIHPTTELQLERTTHCTPKVTYFSCASYSDNNRTISSCPESDAI